MTWLPEPTESDSFDSFRYTSHVTNMFTYQTPTSDALLGVQKCNVSSCLTDLW